MIKETYRNNRFTKIDDERNPNSFKELLGFLTCNGGRDCFSKFQGNVWKITTLGTWEKVCRNVSDLSYSEYLRISLK
jgi:hypothetical protein